ncbi:beta-lactamase family protein, partial [Clostridium frigoris]
ICIFESNKRRRTSYYRRVIVIKMLEIEIATTMLTNSAIDKYIHDYPEGDKIKIHNLLTHTSGIADYVSTGKNDRAYTPEEIIELFKNKPLNFKTGTKYEYCNSDYILLGYIIEKVSGMKYEHYLEKNIFEPLKLNDTGFLINEASIKNKASGYYPSKKTGEYSVVLDTESSTQYSSGGIYSTVDDLYKWEKALFTQKLINKKSLNEMLTPYLQNYGYGYGLIIGKNDEGDKVIWHNGSLPGFSSYIGKNVNKKYLFIILSNKDSYNIEDMVSELSNILKLEK